MSCAQFWRRRPTGASPRYFASGSTTKDCQRIFSSATRSAQPTKKPATELRSNAQTGDRMKEIISTDKAPKAIGPYSQAIKANGLIFTAGQIALDPLTGQLVEGDVARQTARVLDNLKAIVEAAGS